LYDNESADIGADGKAVPFNELDFDWVCPNCGTKSELFLEVDSTRIGDLPEEEEEEEEK
jgi:rubredoxin